MITAPPEPSTTRASRRVSSAVAARRRSPSPWPYRRRLWIAATMAIALHAAVYFLRPRDEFIAAQLDLSEAAPLMEAELVAGEEPAVEPIAEPPPPEPEPIPVPVEQTPPPPDPEPVPDPMPAPVPEPEEMIRPTPELPKPPPAPKPRPTAAKPPAPRPAPSTAAPSGNRGASATGTAGAQGAGNSKPSVLSKVKPPKPTAAELGGVRRTVTITLTVDVTGRVTSVSVASSCGIGKLDRAAVEAVRRWRFKPATRNGVPVAAAAKLDIDYDPPSR